MDEKNEFNRNQTGLEDRDPPMLDNEEHDFTEEFAEEALREDEVHADLYNNEEDRVDPDLNNVYGWIGLALAVISFFIVPVLFAAIAIVLGFVARGRGARILGNSAIIVGIFSILVRLLLLPLL